MAIDVTNLGRINDYFKSVSGFVPNKYYITITDYKNGRDTTNINGIAWSFYAKNVSLPQVKINTVGDIYVSSSSLARPKLPISAEANGDISITFRDDQYLSIYNKLVKLHDSLQGANYEASGELDNISISVKVFNNSTVHYARTYNKCSLFDLVPLRVDSSARKFLEYEAVFTCNDIIGSNYNYDDPDAIAKGSNTSAANSCADLQQKFRDAIKAFKTYKVNYNYIDSSSPQNELNNQIGQTQTSLPIVRLFNDSGAIDRKARSNADIQVSYFMTYLKPAINALKNNGCQIPPLPAIEETMRGEANYVKNGLKANGFII